MLFKEKTIEGQYAYEIQFEESDTNPEKGIVAATISLLKSMLRYLVIIKESKC